MAIVNITVLQPKPEATKSVEYGTVDPEAVTSASDGVVIAGKFDSGAVVEGALQNKNNSLVIYVENTYTTDASSAIIKAGNEYPNKILGDLTVPVGKATAGASSDPDTPVITAIILEDISRFENRDGSIKMTFSTGFTGNVWAVAKRAGMQPKADQYPEDV